MFSAAGGGSQSACSGILVLSPGRDSRYISVGAGVTRSLLDSGVAVLLKRRICNGVTSRSCCFCCGSVWSGETKLSWWWWWSVFFGAGKRRGRPGLEDKTREVSSPRPPSIKLGVCVSYKLERTRRGVCVCCCHSNSSSATANKQAHEETRLLLLLRREIATPRERSRSGGTMLEDDLKNYLYLSFLFLSSTR